MTRANPYPPSGFDGWELIGRCSRLPTSAGNCVTTVTFIFAVMLLEAAVALVFIFRGEQNCSTSGHVWAQNMWEMYLRQFPPAHGVQALLSVHSLFKIAYFLCELDGEIKFHRQGWQDFCPITWVNLSPSFLFFREKYINIILKMEEMLKSWFPNVKLQDQHAVTRTEEAVPTKKPKVKL